MFPRAEIEVPPPCVTDCVRGEAFQFLKGGGAGGREYHFCVRCDGSVERQGGLVRWLESEYLGAVKKEKAKVNAFENNPLARAILREGLAIQDRFLAEPIYARTGKGYLKSAGVSEMVAIKKAEKAKRK